MTITFTTEVLQKHNIPVLEFLDRLKGWFSDQISPPLSPTEILSDNSKDLVACILIESSSKLQESPVKDFEALAQQLMDIYPAGIKPSTTYPWRATVPEIAQKLRTLVAVHNFIFTEQEAIQATKEYVSQFPDDKTHMRLLKYFLLKTKDKEISSDFMTIIENQRLQKPNEPNEPNMPKKPKKPKKPNMPTVPIMPIKLITTKSRLYP